MIRFKDFEKKAQWLGLVAGSLQTAVDAANAWILSHSVIVFNIETINDTAGLLGSKTKEKGVRVWYMLDESQQSNIKAG